MAGMFFLAQRSHMDTDSPGNQAGYDEDVQYNVTGFSQLHDRGTGGLNGEGPSRHSRSAWRC